MENNIEQTIENKKEEKLKKVKNIIEKIQGLLNKKNLFIGSIAIVVITIIFTIISVFKTTPEKIVDKIYKNTTDTLKILSEKANKEIELECELEEDKTICIAEKRKELNQNILELGKKIKENYNEIKKELENCNSFLKGFKAIEKCKLDILKNNLYKISIKHL